jgi:DNA polymerase
MIPWMGGGILMTCTKCPELVMSRKRVCGSDLISINPSSPKVMAIAESPGIDEDNAGVPLVGSSGQEARHHISINGIAAKGIYLDNIIKCHPPGNRDPHQKEIDACTSTYLIPRILELQPEFIISMGKISTEFFLGPVSMEMVHGIPRPCEIMGHKFILIPSYHPAAGLHSPEQMILFQCDMKVAGDVIKGKISPHPPVDTFKGVEDYQEVSDEDV